MVWAAVDKFPHPSVAVHVRVTVYEPRQEPGTFTSLNVKLNALPQLSVAVAWVKEGTAGQWIIVGAGNELITGAVMSCTLMVCEAEDELPQPSIAVHVRVTLYEPEHTPLVVTSSKVKLKALPQPSVADAVAKDGVAGQLIVVGKGKDAITGAVMSCTAIVCEAVDEFPHPSVAVQVRVTL